MSQELDNNVLDLIKQKLFILMNMCATLKSLKNSYQPKRNFYSSLTGKKIRDKEYEHVLKVCNKLEMKTMKDYHDLYLKCDIFLWADIYEKFRNNSFKNYGLCPSY